MPSVAVTSANLEAEGALVELEVRPSTLLVAALTAQRKPIPSAVTVKTQIDTGAIATVIVPEIIAKLGIQPVDYTAVCTPAAPKPHDVPVYNVDLAFRTDDGGAVVVQNASVLAIGLVGVSIRGLIGRNTLKHTTFYYKGRTNQFVLDF